MIWLLLGCSSDDVYIFTTSEQQESIEQFVRLIGDERLVFEVSADPMKSARRSRGSGIALLEAELSPDAYLLENENDSWQIYGDPLGIQYGLADVLEAMNYRFYHPYRSYIPEELEPPDLMDIIGEVQVPEMLRRGLHLHTLHPIEGYYDFWEPSEENLERAYRVIDWTIKNRGNYIV